MEQPYWQRTQLMLQGSDRLLVRRPKLTPALLQKPPFRFLHDVISEVGAAAPVLFRMHLRNRQAHSDCPSYGISSKQYIQQVQATTGYARGLFQGEELDARKLQVCTPSARFMSAEAHSGVLSAMHHS